jgi:hypothetical protein
MDKYQWFSPNGEEIPKGEMDIMFLEFLEKPESIKAPVEPPKNWVEFENRLLAFDADLRRLIFGFIYDIESGKTIKREKTTEAIVEALCNYDKYAKDLTVIHEYIDPCRLLKQILERDAPLIVCDDIYLLGVKRERSGLSLPQKNKIAVQATAQVLWYLEKCKIPTIEKMKKTLLNKKNLFHNLFQLSRFNHSRTIENWVREVFPMPKSSRKRHSSKNELSNNHFDTLIPIPGVFLEDGKMINFLKFRFAIVCLVRVLITLGWSIVQVKNSIFINFYQSRLKFLPYIYVNNWINEAVASNGSIFDP